MTGDVHGGGHPEEVHSMDTHPETGLPIEQCPGRGQHSAHSWNIYDPTSVKLGRVNPAGERTCLGHSPFAAINAALASADARAAVEAIDWDARLRDAVAATLAERGRRRNERRVLAENRDWGLRRRHASKLAGNRGPAGTSDDVSNAGPTVPKQQVRTTTPDGQTGNNTGGDQ